jgi:hypothetical protein
MLLAVDHMQTVVMIKAAFVSGVSQEQSPAASAAPLRSCSLKLLLGS